MKLYLIITLSVLAYCASAQTGLIIVEIGGGQNQNANILPPPGFPVAPLGNDKLILPPFPGPGLIVIYPPIISYDPPLTLITATGPMLSIYLGNVLGQVRQRRFTGNLPSVPIASMRNGVVGFVDSLNSRRASMLTVVSQTDGHIFGAITDHQGFFNINLPPGKYVIAVLNGTDRSTLDAVEAVVHPGHFSFVKLVTVSNFRNH